MQQPSSRPDGNRVLPRERAEKLFQSQRFKQVAFAVLAAFALVLAQDVWARDWMDAGIAAFGVGLIGACLLMNARRYTQLASLLLLVSITLLVTALMWVGQGLHDPALLAYPGILIVGCMLLPLQRFLGLLLFMLLMVSWFALGSLSGQYQPHPPQVTFGNFTYVVAILLATAFIIWLLVQDLRGALSKLRREIEKGRHSEEHVAFLAHHDALTQLPNRILTRDRIERACAFAERNQSQVGVLLIDLDSFKAINESLGHTMGDQLIIEISNRLKNSVRDSDTVGRQGGDEFLVVVTDVRHIDHVSTVANKLLDAIGMPHQLEGQEISSTSSIGIAIYPEDGRDVDTLLKHADIAMYQAKEAGRNTFRFYAEAMNANVMDHLYLLTGMRNALVRDEFILYYQPLLSLASGKVIGAEALIRWRHPELGLIPPIRFIPLAESSGLIVQLGAWVLREACRQAALWQAEGVMPRIVTSVNLSPAQFNRGDIERVVTNALDESGLDPTLLELELTESILIQDAEKVLAVVRRLKAMGVGLSIDDFGTGYSSLSYLTRFEVDKLKIDQSFVRRMLSNQQDAAIVHAVIQMAHSLNLGIVAEGIEDEQTLNILRDLLCEQGQGYFFARPLPAEEFTAFVRKNALG